MALRIILTSLLLTIGGINPSLAQALLKHQVDIQSQQLGSALATLAKQTKIQLVYSAVLVKGLTAPNLHGSMTSQEALAQLLTGTNLEFEFIDAQTVTLSGHNTTSAVSLPTGSTRGAALLRLAVADEPGASAAQAAPAEGAEKSAAAEPGMLEEIVVSARRRNESLQNVPQAITALTEDRLRDLNADTIEDYAATVPGLTLSTRANGTHEFAIRGINATYDSAPATSATVSQYLDETPLTATNSQFDFRLADIQRVEVLRGPQGTFYGEGAMGGTIRLITHKPELHELNLWGEAKLSSTYRGGGNYSTQAGVNVPIAASAALRLNVFDAHDEGFIDNIFTGKGNINDLDSRGARLALRIAPETANTTLEAQVVRQEDRRDYSQGYKPTLGDLNISRVTDGNFADRDLSVGNVVIAHGFGWGRLVSSSSYSRGKDAAATFFNPEENLNFVLGARLAQVEHRHAFAQELRLGNVDSRAGRVSWLGGLFYVDRQREQSTQAFGNLCPFLCPPFSPPTLGLIQQQSNSFQERQSAAFGEVGYDLTSKLTLTGGLRYTKVKQEFDPGVSQFTGDPPLSSGPKFSADTSEVTPKAYLSYKWTEQRLLYLQAAQGFRAGGVNQIGLANPTVPHTFAPDFTWNYEIGTKNSFGDRVTVNAAAFHIDWKDIQAFTTIPSAFSPTGFTSIVANASDAKVDGAELEVSWAASRRLMLHASASYVDSRLTKDQPQVPGGLNGPLLLYPGRKGDRIPNVAREQASFSANYRVPTRLWDSDLVLIGNYRYVGSSNTQFNNGTPASPNNLFFELKPQQMVNIQIGLSNKTWEAFVFADNLLNRRNQLDIIGDLRPTFAGQSFDPTQPTVITDRPRTIGLTLRRKVF